MKKIYTNPICDVERWRVEDIITASPVVEEPTFVENGDGQEVGWLS